MARQNISIVRGTTEYFTVYIVGADDDEPYELHTGEILRFGIKTRADVMDCIIKKELTSEEVDSDGGYTFKFEPSDTKNLPIGTYLYDIGLQSGNDYYPVIEASDFVVAKNATTWEAKT